MRRHERQNSWPLVRSLASLSALVVGIGLLPGCRSDAPASPGATGSVATPASGEPDGPGGEDPEGAEVVNPGTVPIRRTVQDGVTTFDSGRFRVVVDHRPGGFGLRVEDAEGVLTETAPGGGLYVVRAGVRTPIVAASPAGPVFAATFADGALAVLSVGPDAGSDGTMQVRLAPDDPTGVTEWGFELATTPEEAIYGLTERIVDDLGASELVPAEVGGLDRKGEIVTMYTTPTISGYVPFHQSSRGYGILVDGTMPGIYDLGRADPTRIDVRFEMSPRDGAGSFHVLHGRSHSAVVDEYTKLTGRPPRWPATVFQAWRGRDEYRTGATATWHGIEINADVARDLQAYEDHGIPPGVFHFDRPWGTGPAGYGELRFDPERFPNTEAMLAEMRRTGWSLMVWTSPWAIGVLGEEAKAEGHLAPGSDRALDLADPDAVAWITDKLVTFLTTGEGRHVDGFFMDRGEENDVTSTADAVYADGRTGREIHNAYPALFDHVWADAMREARPDGRGFLVARGAYTGSQGWVMRWGGDTHSREGILLPEVPQTTPSTDKGLRSVLISIQRAAFMGTSYWGSDIGGYSNWIDRDLYARWIQVGAVSPLMRFHGKGPAPWDVNPDGSMDEELLAVYTRYVALHHELGPYLERLGEEAARSGMPLVRPLVFTWPDDVGARDRWDEWTLGPDLLAAPVWRSGDRSRSVWFPPGRWVSWWDRTTVIEGPVEKVVDAPLATLPLYVREGSDLLRAR